jgi:glutamine synthetase
MKSREFLGELETPEEEELVKRIHDNISTLLKLAKKLKQQRAALLESEEEDFTKALGYKNAILPLMAELRVAGDTLETLVAKDYWPLPTYEEMLFKL